MAAIVSDELIEIKIKYAELTTKNGRTVTITDEKELEKHKAKIKEYKEIVTNWQEPNWKENNAMVFESLEINPLTGQKEQDWIKFTSINLEKCLKAWDLKDEKGNLIPLNPENIGKLNPQIATKLIQQFMMRNAVTDEDLGN